MNDQDEFFKELFGDFSQLTPEERDRRKKSLREQLLKVLATLTPREEQVLRKRFGIGEDEGTPVIDREFEASRERIRQIEAKALAKLRHPSRSRQLRIILERQDERGQQ